MVERLTSTHVPDRRMERESKETTSHTHSSFISRTYGSARRLTTSIGWKE